MKRFFPVITIVLIALIFVDFSSAQDSTKSLAFKNNKPQKTTPYFYRPDLAYQIWQQFRLTQEANAGDPLAEHELGLRYLLGEGIPADTVKALFWIQKAASKNLTAAKYNYAIMLINGIGVPWDPFKAFKYFKSAANDGMVQAQYVVGVLYTDNLLVNANYNLAYYWVKKSSEADFEPANEVLVQLEPKISKEVVDSLFKSKTLNPLEDVESYNDPTDTKLTSNLGLSFIDFDAVRDSAVEITDSMIIADVELMAGDSLIKFFKADSLKSFDDISSSEKIAVLKQIADNGSPEAQTIIGRMYQLGLYFSKNEISAAAYYYRALRNDSPKATNLLWQLAQKQSFIILVQREAEKGNTEAEFVWYGLTTTQFDNRIALNDALNLLKKSADKFYLPAMNELGLNYYSGRFFNQDLEKGIEIWNQAEQLGSLEATVRLTASRSIESIISTDTKRDFKTLKSASENGSLLAQVSIGICYKNGIGTNKSIAEAVKYFRMAAQRGSQYAYDELKQLYDQKRPEDAEFLIVN